jgi:hypothetical protein
VRTKIGTIAQEKKACRAAFLAYPDSKWVWCCHHEKHCEPLTDPAVNRIYFILLSKTSCEQAIRLHNFRPCKNAEAMAQAQKACDEAVDLAIKAYDKAAVQAKKAYNETLVQADKVWHEAMVQADKTWLEAVVQADKAYNKAVTLANKALRVMHKKEWPDNTWNGKSIFK